MFQGNYPHAIEYFQKALKINEELGNNPGVTNCLNNIGIIYYYQANYPKALEYYNKALKINEEMGDKSAISNCLNNIANIHFNEGNYSLALKYYQETLNYFEEIDNKSSITSALNNIGIIHENQGDYLQALEYFQKSLGMRKKIGDKLGICNSYSNIGKVFLKTKNYTKALDYTLKSLKLANELDLLINQANIHGLLSEIYVSTKNYQEAYENQVLYKKLNDSIFNETNIKEITNLENKYKFEKELQAIKMEQQRKDATQIEEVRRQKKARNSFIGGFLLMALLVLIALRGFLQKRKSNRILLAQKNKIEEKNTELLFKNEEIKARTEEIKTTNNKLKELNATKDKFFSIIAHDLRSPFNSMLGFSNLLLENHRQLDENEMEEYIKVIDNSAKQAYKLLDNLLNWARVQTEGFVFNPKEQSLDKIFIEVIKLNTDNAEMKNIKLSYNLSKDINIYADSDMIEIILRNLISNAIKFTHKNGEVKINAEQDNDNVIISVSDTGIGMLQEKVQKIFDIGEKISTVGTENEKGTGLGLILCKEFVEKHGGKIWIESEIEKGSKFIISIPNNSN
jgi:signal transduction histidine kinase